MHKHRGTLGPSRGPQGRSRLDPSPERETGAVLFQLMLGPVAGLCVAAQTSSAGVSQEGICLGRFSAGWGVRAGIFREQWSLKHCTDWGSFETFPCPWKGDPPLKRLQALGSPPGTISKTFSSSCCLCTCLPPVALTWQCLKLLPLLSHPALPLMCRLWWMQGRLGLRAPGSMGGSEQPWQQPKHGNLSVQPLPSAWGSPGTSVSITGPPPSPCAGSGCSHPALPREIHSGPCTEIQGLDPGFSCWVFTASHSQAGFPN